MCNAPLLVALILAFFVSVGNAFVPSTALAKAATQCKASSTVAKRSGAATAVRATSTMSMGEVVDLTNREFQVSLFACTTTAAYSVSMFTRALAIYMLHACSLRKLASSADTLCCLLMSAASLKCTVPPCAQVVM
jgi:hypothetical protein